MTNLGTKYGERKPNSLQISPVHIAGDYPPAAAHVSEYARSYGTFSGADIKVIVHYPVDPQVEQILNQEKAELEAQIAAEEAWFWENRDGLSTSDMAGYVQNKNVLNTDLEMIGESISRIKELYNTSRTLGEVQSVSWGLFRDLAPFRPMGSTYPRSFTKGPRSIAGSMVFTIFHEHVFHELMDLNLRLNSIGTSDYDRHHNSTMLVDQLPPLDISFICANEYGAISHMGIWGVQFFQEGGVFSIEDIYAENQIQYVARDFDPLRVVESRVVDGHGITDEWNTSASDMLHKHQLEAQLKRRNPFI